MRPLMRPLTRRSGPSQPCPTKSEAQEQGCLLCVACALPVLTLDAGCPCIIDKLRLPRLFPSHPSPSLPPPHFLSHDCTGQSRVQIVSRLYYYRTCIASGLQDSRLPSDPTRPTSATRSSISTSFGQPPTAPFTHHWPVLSSISTPPAAIVIRPFQKLLPL